MCRKQQRVRFFFSSLLHPIFFRVGKINLELLSFQSEVWKSTKFWNSEFPGCRHFITRPVQNDTELCGNQSCSQEPAARDICQMKCSNYLPNILLLITAFSPGKFQIACSLWIKHEQSYAVLFYSQTGKNEVALEFHQNDDAQICLMEMRFYIPTPADNPTEDPVKVCSLFLKSTFWL